MPLSRANLERQLEQAKQVRDACAQRLQQGGVSEAELKKQPAWRSAHATYRQLVRRLRAVSAKEQLAGDVAARKAARDSAAE